MKKNHVYLFVVFALLSLLLFLCILAYMKRHSSSQLCPKIPIYSETFDFQPSGLPNGWETYSLPKQGPGANTPDKVKWEMTPDGKAEKGAYWEGRTAIQSRTASTGALVFNSDFLDNGGTPNNPGGSGSTSWAPHEGALVSPLIKNIDNYPSIAVKFHQYFRGHKTHTYLDVSTDGKNWDSIEINQNLTFEIDGKSTRRPFGGETSPDDVQFINISKLVRGHDEFRIRFRFKGSYYFWIVDDVEVVCAPEKDLAIKKIVWPAKEHTCILGEEEKVQIEIHNYGDKAVSGFPVYFYLNGDLTCEQEVEEKLFPNESRIFTFTQLVDFKREDTLIQYALDVFIDKRGDCATENNQLSQEEMCCLRVRDSMLFVDYGVPIGDVPGDSLPGDTTDEGEFEGDQQEVDGEQEVVGKRGINQTGQNPVWLKDSADAQNGLYGTYICNQLIVKFKSGTPTAVKDSIRNSHNANVIDFCSCDTIELWEAFDASNIVPKEIVPEDVASAPEVDEAEHNYLTRRRKSRVSLPPGAYVGTQGKRQRGSAIITAVLDTGWDFYHDSVKAYSWKNEKELRDPYGTDTDGNCYYQDNWGLNLIDRTMPPFDDQTHGTHVGGTSIGNLPSNPSESQVHVMPIKVLAQNGGGTLFELVCGVKYATESGAKIINMSLGYYGPPSRFLDSLINIVKQQNIMLIAAAGNESNNNDSIPFWPANFNHKHGNVISVTADSAGILPKWANYGAYSVDIATKGVEVLGPIPENKWAKKSGTSMATPYVARAFALALAKQPSDTSYIFLKNRIYGETRPDSKLRSHVRDGRRLVIP